MKLIFWFSLFWIIYAYGGYIALLMFVTLFKRKEIANDENFQPLVSLIIAAYNEEKSIEEKIKNCLELDYPKDRFEILIVSDGSTDRTDKIASRYKSQGIILKQMPNRGGKTAAQNYAFGFAKGELLIFSDATTIYKKDALKKLVRHFSDSKVGCVGGEERFLDPKGGKITKEVSLFWRYEQLLRQKESDFNTLIGVSGCIFAIRKRLYEPLDETLIEDFALPLKVASLGYKVVYEKEAIGYEKAAIDTHQEFARKARIVEGGMNVLWKKYYLLIPFRFPLLSFQLISHKIFRWLAPIFIILLSICNLFLWREGIGYFIFGILQFSIYLLAVCRLKVLQHFCLVNLAGLVGIFKFLKGERKVMWEPVRQ